MMNQQEGVGENFGVQRSVDTGLAGWLAGWFPVISRPAERIQALHTNMAGSQTGRHSNGVIRSASARAGPPFSSLLARARPVSPPMALCRY